MTAYNLASLSGVDVRTSGNFTHFQPIAEAPMRRRRLYWRIFWTSAAIAATIAAMLGPYAAYRAGRERENQVWSRLESAAAAAEIQLASRGPPAIPTLFCPTLPRSAATSGIDLTFA